MHDLRRNAFAFVTASAAALCCSTQSPAGESTGPTGKQYFFCSSAPDQPVVYFSDFFVADAGGGATTAHNVTPLGPDPSVKVQSAFFAYLKHKYSFKSNSNYPTGCPYFGAGAAGLSLAKASKANLESQYLHAKEKIVETGWKFTSGDPHKPR